MDDYDCGCVSGLTRKQSELLAAFNRFAPKPNWKSYIDTYVSVDMSSYDTLAAEIKLLNDACVHFTGGELTVVYYNEPKGTIHVKSPGYYAMGME